MQAHERARLGLGGGIRIVPAVASLPLGALGPAGCGSLQSCRLLWLMPSCAAGCAAFDGLPREAGSTAESTTAAGGRSGDGSSCQPSLLQKASAV
jgi:hypothetical protein